MKRKLFLFVILISLMGNINAQVGINTTNPSPLAVLDIQNIVANGDTVPQGVTVPKLTEKQRNKIDLADPILANGLLIYNVDEDCYNYFSHDEEKWRSLCGSYGKSEFDFDCSAITPLGNYTENKELNTNNKLKIIVNVTKPGSYSIHGTTTNGYFFSTSGTFLGKGTFTIYVDGQGTPLVAGVDVVSLQKNGEDVACATPLTITVLTSAGNYTLDCRGAIVNGVYEVNKALTLSHKITLKVNVLELGSWSVTSDLVEGISFSGQGVFTALGPQSIVIYGEGAPLSVKPKEITFTTNSKGGSSTTCSTIVRITIPQKTFLSLGDNNHSLGGTAGIGYMFKNSQNFGSEENSTFKTYTPKIINNGTIDGKITAAILKPYLEPTTGKPVDILFSSYNADFTNDAVSILIKYLNAGGVVIMFNEHLNESSGNINFLTTLFNYPAMQSSDDYIPGGQGWILRLPIMDDMILNGPFGDVRGEYIGNDNGYEDVMWNLPDDQVDWKVPALNYNSNSTSTNGSPDKIVLLKAKYKNFVWGGDGGFAAAGNGSATNMNWYPVTTTGAPHYTPSSRPYGNTNGTTRVTVYNAAFVANLLAWAIQTAEESGINSY